VVREKGIKIDTIRRTALRKTFISANSHELADKDLGKNRLRWLLGRFFDRIKV